MNWRTQLFLLSGLAFWLAACGGPAEQGFTKEQQAAQTEAFKSMMEAHDLAMEENLQMNKVALELQTYQDSLEDKRLAEEVMLTVRELETTDDAMMAWMQNSPKLGKLRDSLEHEQIIAVLQQEEEAIARIGEDINNGLEKGQALLEKVKNQKTEQQ